jgi:RNA polymerase sigma-70 factor (ECF subfamily)
MSDADEALARRAKEGDRAAFEELVRRTSRLVFARLYLETGDTHRAEDLLQDTLLAAFRSVRQLKEPRQFRAWLLTIAQNVAIDASRHDLRLKRTQAGTAKESPDSQRPDEEIQHREMRERILAILRSLPDEYRLPLTLRYITGADYETIQMQLGLTNGSLRGVLHRGLKLMRQRLGNEFLTSA